MFLIDTHCHLDVAEFDVDREPVYIQATQAGVRGMVVPAVDRVSFSAVCELPLRYPGCVYGLGIHPLYVAAACEQDLEALRERLHEGGATAVGEIGLDFLVEGHDRERQEWFFIEQLKLAREFDLPVILHLRRAQDAVLKHLRRFRVRGGFAHAFNGSWQQAEAFIGLGFKLGFGGAMTYDRALRLRELAARLPADAIVLETDAPDIAPAWAVRQRNVPANLARIAATLATLRGTTVAAVAEMTTVNALEVIPGLSAALGDELSEKTGEKPLR